MKSNLLPRDGSTTSPLKILYDLIGAKNKLPCVPLSSDFSSSVWGSVGEAAFTGVVDSGVSKAPSESELLKPKEITKRKHCCDLV